MRDSRGKSQDPRPLGELLGEFRSEVAPATPLAAVQMIWDEIVGERIAAVTSVIEGGEGVVTVSCSSAVWAQELELMAPRIIARLEKILGDQAPEKLRFRATS